MTRSAAEATASRVTAVRRSESRPSTHSRRIRVEPELFRPPAQAHADPLDPSFVRLVSTS